MPGGDYQIYLGYFVALVFATGVIINLVGPAGIRDAYTRWGYPPYFRFVTAAVEALALVLIMVESTRTAGLALAAMVMLAAITTLVRASETKHALPALVVMISAIVAAL